MEKTLSGFAIPPEGLEDNVRKEKLGEFYEYILNQKNNFLGYQANQKMDYQTDTMKFLDCHVNNIGDPFVDGNFTVNSKVMERAVLDYYAKLWNAKFPYSANEPDSYWGYVLTMGSTEGNLYALWNARDYLSGKKLSIDKSEPKKPRMKYFRAIENENNPNAYTPVAFFSEDTHYSIIKATKVLEIPTYDEIGKKYFPNQNPITPDGEWSSPEVPSFEGKLGPGEVDVDKLKTLVEFFASKGFPILIICNFGTTFKGAYDDVQKISDTLYPIFRDNGLVNREVEYEHGKKDTRNGFWIHVDGALGASSIPFLKMAMNKGLTKKVDIPDFDFKVPLVNSLVTSGHKWPGAPWPCGVFMTKVKYQLFPPDDPEYIGSPDTTFAGSRNGFSSIIWWDYLAKNSYDKQIEKIVRCEEIASYAKEKLETLKPYHIDIDLWIAQTNLSLTVRFRRPNKEIVYKYSLSCETLEVNGETRHYAHVFAMDSADKESIDRLIEDLKSPDAFDDTHEQDYIAGFGLGCRNLL